MAGVFFVATPTPAAVGNPKTMVQLLAASNHRILIHAIFVTFNGTSATEAPVLVEAGLQDGAGTSSSLTLAKANAADDETLQTTALQTFSAEPSNTTPIYAQWYVHPQSGIVIPLQMPKPQVVLGSGRWALRVTSALSVNFAVTVHAEE